MLLGKTIAENSNERTVMGTPKGVHERGLNPACRLLSFLPMLESRGIQKGLQMNESLLFIPRDTALQEAGEDVSAFFLFGQWLT